jgi:hypothetical protein
MKKLLTIAVLGMTLVGCASTPSMSPETAINLCSNAGVKKGTPAFVDCMTNVLNSEAAKGKPSFAGQYMLNRASSGAYNNQPNYGPETTTCSGTGSTRTCNTSGGGSMFMRTTTCTGTGDIRTCTTN